MDFVIDEMLPTDWPQVAEIYLAGIETGLATKKVVSVRLVYGKS